ncbi:hypothetical protein GYH30_022106 [Glycine max]|uniref:Germin-like protein n=1 Tax=Glycine max TaxID=3847 RepID=A0A0R0IZ14_SOYBN|nr:hypothetical protein GYH30_022106 [Glycine max]
MVPHQNHLRGRKTKVVYFLVAILALTSSVVSAYDPVLCKFVWQPKKKMVILIVLEGTLYVGFVTSNQGENHLFTKVLNKGDVFVFPIGLIHFQLNVGYDKAVAIPALSSQNAGTTTIANALFKANPPISPEVLTKAFQVDQKVIDELQKKSWCDTN